MTVQAFKNPWAGYMGTTDRLGVTNADARDIVCATILRGKNGVLMSRYSNLLHH
jgi:hypothetical protein